MDNAPKKENRTSRRGFASMDPARQKEIASMGGKASHESGNAHQFTSEEARAAGRKSRAALKTAEIVENPHVKALVEAAEADKKAMPPSVVIPKILKKV